MTQDMLDGIGKWSLAAGVIGTVCYLAVAGKIDASVITGFAFTAIGYYFGKGGKAQ